MPEVRRYLKCTLDFWPCDFYDDLVQHWEAAFVDLPTRSLI